MDINITALSEKTGCNLKKALERFKGMERLYEKLLQKFLTDPSFGELEKAAEERDLCAIERAARTLKGVSGSLGLNVLQESSDNIARAAKEGRKQEIQVLLIKCSEDYERIIEAIQEVIRTDGKSKV